MLKLHLLLSIMVALSFACPQNCQNCSQVSDICQKCAQNYELMNNRCLLPSTANKDLKCQVGEYLSEKSECLGCGSSCVECEDVLGCVNCGEGYQVKFGRCYYCGEYCNNRGDLLVKCFNPNARLLVQTQGVEQQQINEGFPPWPTLCSPCPSGCSACINRDCTVCVEGYYLLNKICIACSNGCRTCNHNIPCQRCFSGFLFVNQTCQPCKDQKCKTCSTQTDCLTCRNRFYPNNDHVCKPCKSNCLRCSDDSSCSKCQERYYYQNSTCLDCIYSCLSCDNITSCNQCSISTFYNSTINECSQCLYGCDLCNDTTSCIKCDSYNYLFNNGCERCDYNCATCLTQLGCTQCALGYYLEGQNCQICDKGCLDCTGQDKCTSCQVNYYLQEGICFGCVQNCIRCRTNLKCTKCRQGYYLQENKCLSCDSRGCKQCQSNKACELCLQGYSKQGGKCIYGIVAQKNQDKAALQLQFIVPIAVMALVIFLGILYCIKKKCDTVLTKTNNVSLTSATNLASVDENQPNIWQVEAKHNSLVKEECPICNESQANCKSSCGHHFHLRCIVEWIKRMPHCPTCRVDNFESVKIYCASCSGQSYELKTEQLNKIQLNDSKAETCRTCIKSLSAEKVIFEG